MVSITERLTGATLMWMRLLTDLIRTRILSEAFAHQGGSGKHLNL